MFKFGFFAAGLMAFALVLAGVDHVRDVRAAGFPQVTLTNSVSGQPVTVQADAHQGTVSLATTYGTGSLLTAGALSVFVTAPVPAVCAAIGGLSFTAQPTFDRAGNTIPGGPVCVGASDRVYWEPFNGGTRIYSIDGGLVAVTATPATVAAAIAAVP